MTTNDREEQTIWADLRAVFRRCEAILGDFFVRSGIPENGDDDGKAIGDDSGAEC